MKDGLVFENEELVYYRFGVPCHAGIVRTEDGIYYIGRDGKAVKGEYVVHSSMTHGIIPHGTYRFGDDYRLVDGYYVQPKRTRSSKQKRKAEMPVRLKAISIAAVMIAILAIIVIMGIMEPSSVLN